MVGMSRRIEPSLQVRFYALREDSQGITLVEPDEAGVSVGFVRSNRVNDSSFSKMKCARKAIMSVRRDPRTGRWFLGVRAFG